MIVLAALALTMAAGAAAQTADDGYKGRIDAAGVVWTIAPLAAGGKIVIGGQFTQVNGQPRADLARLNADGSMDPTFSATAVGGVEEILELPDGRLLVGGTFYEVNGQPRTGVVRLLADGALDPTFTTGGTDGGVLVLVAQPDGAILVGGSFSTIGGQPRMHLARLHADGTLDAEFAPVMGSSFVSVESLALQRDGRLLVGGGFEEVNGQPQRYLARLHPDGSLDTSFLPTFNTNGRVHAILAQPDGHVLIGGYFTQVNGQSRNWLARFAPDGSLAAAPSAPDAIVLTLMAQPDGRILMGGYFELVGGAPHASLARLFPDGTLDPSFTASADGAAWTFVVQDDGKVLLGGLFQTLNGQTRPHLARVYANGALDASVATSTSGAVRTVATQPDGAAIVGGTFLTIDGATRHSLARLAPDGGLDAAFVAPDDSVQVYGAAVARDGTVLVTADFTTIGGQPKQGYARFLPGGALDTSFTIPPFSNYLYSVAALDDGRALIAGSFGDADPTTSDWVAIVQNSGAHDASFAPGVFGTVRAMLVQPDDQILIGGSFFQVNGVTRQRLARVGPTGVRDADFNPPTPNNDVDSMMRQPDGKILIVGAFTLLGSTPQAYIARLLADGSLDPDFDVTVDAPVHAIALQADGRIVIGGAFTDVNGTPRASLARLLPDGSLDPDFTAETDVNGTVYTLAFGPDGKLWVGGYFATLAGDAHVNVGRLLLADAPQPQRFELSSDRGTVIWTRGGTLPELARVSIEQSLDGATWTDLGVAAQAAGGWALEGLTLPRNQNVWLRASGVAYHGKYNAGSRANATRLVYLPAHNVTPNAGAHGTLSLAAVQLVDEGEALVVTVSADATYHIATVTGCGGTLVGTTYTTAPITAACTVAATFAINTYTVTSAAGAHGTIAAAGTQTVEHGDVRVFTVTPAINYHIEAVTGCGGALVGSTYTTAPIVAACAVTASFAIDTYTVTATAGAHGTITAAGVQTVDHGDVRAFTLTPETGYHIDTVTGCGGALVGSIYTTAPIVAACAVTASFAIDTYTVTATTVGNGTISPAGAQSVDHGGTLVFTVTSGAGSHLDSVSGCGGALSGTSFTTAAIVASCTITATFAVDPPQTPTSFTRYFAEGAVNSFFTTRLAVLNPHDDVVTLSVRLSGANGQQATIAREVPARTRTTFDLNTEPNLPDSSFSTSIESDRPIVADRLMTWDASGYGSSLEAGGDAPGRTWFLAEGATGVFSLYYLLQNPGSEKASVRVSYLLPAPAAPIVKTYTVEAHSRATIDVTGEDAALAATEVAAKITSDQPVFVERAMYLHAPGQPFVAGHAGAGIPAAATRWFVAEGATGFFDEYVLIANGEATAADVVVTYLIEGAAPLVDRVTVDAHSRRTLELGTHPELASAAVSVIIESMNSVPVAVERVMWWPRGQWYEASASAGVTSAGTKWAFAEGEQGGAANSQTFIAIANTDPTLDGSATVTLLFEDGTSARRVVPLPAARRATVDAGTFPEARNRRFGAIVESDGVPIVVERTLYQSTGGLLWSAGGAAVATRLTP